MSGFQHSVKVPTQYRRAAAVLRSALENKQKSIKSLIYGTKHAQPGYLHNLIKLYIDNRGAIDTAIEETNILKDNIRLDPTLCKVLITELIYRKSPLKGESKPVQTVRNYKEILEQLLIIPNNSSDTKTKDIKPRYVRVNTNLFSLEQAQNVFTSNGFRKKENSFENYEDFMKAVKDMAEDEYILDINVDNLLIFHPEKKNFFPRHKCTLERKFMLQDKGTCLVAELLSPPVGSTVLDMCAAPGMKTIHICNVLQNRGTIYAVEKDAERYNVLCKMTEEAGCKIVKTIHADAFTVTAKQCPGVEYILVDPSCTGSGMQNRLSLQPEEKNPERLRKMSVLQTKMLSYAMTAFPDVKRIAYSTCSLYQEENEKVVQKCLELHPDFKLLSGKMALRNKWHSVGSSEFKHIGKKCIYSRPNEDLTEGIFIAIFEKISKNE